MTKPPLNDRRLVGLAAATLIVCCTTMALAQETSALRGEMYVAGKTPIDPPKDEQKNSHAYMTITGPAALRMYRSMRAK